MSKFYLIIAARLRVLVSLILKNGISINRRNVLFLPLLLQASLTDMLNRAREKVLFDGEIKETKVPADPIFIIGHWRTGSTFLHQLFQLDPGMTTPTLLQCTYPDSYISGQKPIAFIMGRFLKKTRPMDNVRLDLEGPQEEEYALFRMTGISPLERLIFPHSSRYFLLDSSLFTLSGPRKQKWENAFKYFTKKLFMHTGRRIVFKNPFNSFRIKSLLELFPEAKFIHIFRDPLKVVPSTQRMWSIVGADNTLRNEWKAPSFDEVVTGFDRLMTVLDKDLSTLSEDRYIELRFEDLEKDPAGSINRIYKHFGIEYSMNFKKETKKFLKKNSTYKKNRYQLTDTQKEMIKRRLRPYMIKGGYL